MRWLLINGITVDIDEQTAIGITLQTYDVKEPGKRKINVSNTFTIPKTSVNNALFGFADDPQTTAIDIYDVMYCDYWIDNEKLIDNAKVRVQEIQDRISLFVFQKDDVWDLLKSYMWSDFVPEFLTWLQTEKGYPDVSNPTISSLETFLTTYKENTDGLTLPMYFGNLYNYVYNKIGDTKSFAYTASQTTFTLVSEFTYKLTNWDSSGSNNIDSFLIDGGSPTYPFLIEKGETYNFQITKSTSGQTAELSFFGEDVFLEDTTNIWLKYYPESESIAGDGGHFCAFTKTIFEFLEYKYDVNFCVNEVGVTGNIWDDTYASAVYTPIRDIDVRLVAGGFYFDIRSGIFLPEKEDLKDKPDKSMYDYVNAFFQHFNIIKDEIEISNEPAIRLARFDDIKTLAPIQKFSGKIQGRPKFKPYVEGYAQTNTIKFDSIFPEGNEFTNARTVTCLNKNLDAQTDLFSIDTYIPAFVVLSNNASDVAPDLSISDSFKTFEFFINSGETENAITVHISEDSEPISATLKLNRAAIYSLSGEYVFLNEIMARPKFYEIQKWLTLTDIRAIEFFKQYYIQELNGSFFINKISGFNPQKSNEPTKIEVIRISNKVVIDFLELVFYVDGLGNNFVDGNGNKFF